MGRLHNALQVIDAHLGALQRRFVHRGAVLLNHDPLGACIFCRRQDGREILLAVTHGTQFEFAFVFLMCCIGTNQSIHVFRTAAHEVLQVNQGSTATVLAHIISRILATDIHPAGVQLRLQQMEERLALCEPAIQKLWCEEDGFFYNLRTDTGEFNKHISPTNFYALYSSSVTKEQCRRVIDEHFYNPEEYWGDYILPSIARNDPAYPEQEYWRGRIWAPMNFLTYGALTAQGLVQPMHDLAVRSKNLLLKEWLEKGHVHENYCADTGAGCNSNSSDAFYHWGGLLGLIALREAGQA